MRNGQIPHSIALNGYYFDNNRPAKVLLYPDLTKTIFPITASIHPKMPPKHQLLRKINKLKCLFLPFLGKIRPKSCLCPVSFSGPGGAVFFA